MNERYVEAVKKYIKMIPAIVGIDPGGNTGLVRLQYGRIVGLEALKLDKVYAYCANDFPKDHTWVMEEFLLYPWVASKLSFDQIPAARAIGAFEVGVHRCGGEVIYQTASDAKEAVKDNMIRCAVDGVPNRITKHEMDALRHVVFYAARELSRLDTVARRRV